jgi:anti-sigma28 factor (negative regulator of flagellin synthesis)
VQVHQQSAMQSAKQKSARKEQHKFQEGNRANMVPTKLVEWADKARNMIFVVKMQGQHTHKVESDTFRQIKEDEPRIWAWINVWLVYIMKRENRLIYLCKKYARPEKVILVEVYVRKREKKLTVEDNDMGIMVILVFVEVIVTVFEMEYITAGMQKSFTVEEGYINVSMEVVRTAIVEVVRTAIVEVVRTAITEGEYNTAEFEKKLTVDDVDINMSVEVVRTAIVEVVRTAIVEVVRTAIVEVVRTAITEGEYNTAEFEKKLTVDDVDINMSVEVVRTAIVEVVRTAITKGEYNTVEMKKKLTVKKRDISSNMFEDIHVEDVNIVKFVVMVKEVFYNKFEGIHMRKVVIFKFEEVVRMIIDKKEYNTTEMREELVIEENNILLEDTNMMETVIFKFEKTVIKMDYRTAEMKKSFTVKKEESTKKREDFWSFRDIETRQDSVLS